MLSMADSLTRSTDCLDSLVQGRPFLFNSFILNLPQLRLGNLVLFDDVLQRLGDGHLTLVLGQNKSMKNLSPLLNRQALGRHQSLLGVEQIPGPEGRNTVARMHAVWLSREVRDAGDGIKHINERQMDDGQRRVLAGPSGG
jgi:hypothetical protein